MSTAKRKTIVGLLICAAWLGCDPVLFAQSSGLFTQPQSAAAASRIAAFDRSVLRSRVVTVDFPRLGSGDVAADRDAFIELNLFDDASFTAVLDRVDPTGRGFVWVGRIPAIPMSTVSLATEDGVMHGSVQTPDATYVVRFIGNGLYTIDEIDQGAFPPEAQPLPMDALAGTASAPDTLNELDVPQGDGASFIDIMVLYTPSARTAAGGTSAINALIANAISVTNTAYANSNIVQRLRLAHASEVSYTETGDLVSDLQNVTNGAGTLGGVASLRDTYRADLVTLMTSTPGSPYCGVAWLMTSVSGSFQSLGFNVVEQTCAVGNLSFAHELGHNMGLRHDWYVDSGTTPYTYAHGHVNVGTSASTRWRTIMSYNDKCSNQGVNCTRLTYFSNPQLSYLSAPMGVPAGTNATCTTFNLNNPPCDADERLALNNTALTVANFRQNTLSVTSLTANVTFPVAIGTPVTWTAVATSGTSPYSFRFWVYDGATWSVGQDWSASNTWMWTPLAGGTYAFQVWVRNAGSSAAYDAWLGAGPFVVNGPQPLTVTSFTGNQAFPIPAGTPVNWTASASGGIGPYTYKFWIHNGSTWTVGRDWGASSSFAWSPSLSGTYSFQVWARNAGSSANQDAWRGFGSYVVTAAAPLTATSLVANRVFPVAAGTPVTWTALARGGNGPYSYKVWVYNGSFWTIGQDWSASSTWTWVPPGAGSYSFQLCVRNAGSANPCDAWLAAGPAAIGPSGPLSVTSLSVSPMTPVIVGTPTTIAAVATGGLGPYTYKFWIHNGTGWSVGQDWSAASSFNWIPSTTGSHSFQVWVRNVGSATALDAWGALGPIMPLPDKR